MVLVQEIDTIGNPNHNHQWGNQSVEQGDPEAKHVDGGKAVHHTNQHYCKREQGGAQGPKENEQY